MTTGLSTSDTITIIDHDKLAKATAKLKKQTDGYALFQLTLLETALKGLGDEVISKLDKNPEYRVNFLWDKIDEFSKENSVEWRIHERMGLAPVTSALSKKRDSEFVYMGRVMGHGQFGPCQKTVNSIMALLSKYDSWDYDKHKAELFNVTLNIFANWQCDATCAVDWMLDHINEMSKQHQFARDSIDQQKERQRLKMALNI